MKEKFKDIKLNWDIVNELRNKYNNGYTIYKLSKEYNINSGTIYGVVKNKYWK